MATNPTDIDIYQGATFNKVITITDALLAPIDITGESYAGQVRSVATDGTDAGDFVFTIQNQVTNTGEVLFQMLDTVTSLIPVDTQLKAAIKPTKYAYDVERTKVDGTKQRILWGVANVWPEVTR